MKIPRRTGAPPRRSSRWAAIVGAAALVTSLAACSSSPAGVVVNLSVLDRHVKIDANENALTL